MLRKILLSLLILILLAAGGLFGLLATNSDIIIDRFHSYVENSTGAPLVSDTRPEFTILPNRGLELGASSWERPDGSLRIRFSRASVLISSHALFAGRFSIKNVTVEDLDLTMRLDKPLFDLLGIVPDKLGQRNDVDSIIRFILNTLNIAPDSINVQRGRICLIEPNGNTLVFDPFSLKAHDVHPGSETEFFLHTEISGTAPAFRTILELDCSALFAKGSAVFSVKNASLIPHTGFPFTEELRFSGSVGYDYQNSSMTLSSLAFKGPGADATLSGSILSLEQFYKDPNLGEASFQLNAKGDLQRLGKLLDRPLNFTDEETFKDCAVSTELNWKKGELHLNAIQGHADDLTFSGGLQVAMHPFVVTGDLKVNDLRFDNYKSTPSEGGSSNFGQNDFTRWPRVSLHLSAENLYWDRLHLQKVSARMTGQNGTYELNPINATLTESPVIASLKSVMLPTSPLSARIALNVSIPKANLEDLGTLLVGRGLLQGNGAVNAALSFTSSRGVSSLSGTGSLTSSSLKTAFPVLPPDTPFANLLTASNSFNKLLVSFHAREGRIAIEQFSLSSSRLAPSGSGDLDLPGKKIDATGTLRVGGSTVLPVRLYGNVHDPRYSLDIRSSRKEPASIDVTLDKNFSKQLDKLLGAPR
ncbi:MAG: hypothetical protein IJY48_00895 [Mailhella sp.]|nr:hypothetical protein [Mailhella sp.]